MTEYKSGLAAVSIAEMLATQRRETLRRTSEQQTSDQSGVILQPSGPQI